MFMFPFNKTVRIDYDKVIKAKNDRYKTNSNQLEKQPKAAVKQQCS